MTSAKFSIKHCTKMIKLNSSELWKKFSSSDMWFLCYSYVPRHSLILECLISRRVVSVTSRTLEVSRLVARCPPCLSDPPYQTLTCCWPSGGLWVFLIIVFTIIVIIAKRRFVGFTIIYCNIRLILKIFHSWQCISQSSSSAILLLTRVIHRKSKMLIN